MSLALFMSIVVLIVIFALATTIAFAVYMHFFMKSAMNMQLNMIRKLGEDDDADLDAHYGENPDVKYFEPNSN